MKIEYALHDIESNDKVFKETFSKILEYPIQQISVLPQHLKLVKKVLPKQVQLSAPIDFPFGTNTDSIRRDMIKFAIDHGVDCVEVVAPNRPLCNRNYTQIQNEIAGYFNMCVENMVDISYTLEYRRFSFTALARIAKSLHNNSIFKFYVSSGNKLDDIHDHIIAINVLQKEAPEATIPYNGNLWLKEHLDLLYESQIKSIRSRTLNALDIIFNKIA